MKCVVVSLTEQLFGMPTLFAGVVLFTTEVQLMDAESEGVDTCGAKGLLLLPQEMYWNILIDGSAEFPGIILTTRLEVVFIYTLSCITLLHELPNRDSCYFSNVMHDFFYKTRAYIQH